MTGPRGGAGSRSVDNVRAVELTDQAGEARRLSEALAQGAVVLVFYRGDW